MCYADMLCVEARHTTYQHKNIKVTSRCPWVCDVTFMCLCWYVVHATAAAATATTAAAAATSTAAAAAASTAAATPTATAAATATVATAITRATILAEASTTVAATAAAQWRKHSQN